MAITQSAHKTKRISLRTITLAVCLIAVSASGALAQFTIRQPADGSTTREKVKVEIPRASIRPGGFVTIYIDDKFRVALNPKDDTTKPFTYYWDTKAEDIPDGEHTIRAVLSEPASQGSDAVNEMATSEVKINLANKIKGETSLLLRYKFHESETLEYRRDSRAYVVGAESANGSKATGDIELNAVKSKLVLGIDDVRPAEDIALVRNKVTFLSMLTDQKEYTFSPEDLTGSLYQELSQRGEIKYVAGLSQDFLKYAMAGLAIENTLDLPVLPLTPVTIGQTWTTPGQSLELPGLPAILQPGVKMDNKFEGLEWEDNYKTAKIRQSYKGQPVKSLYFGTVLITAPTITIDKVYYVAYKSGRLIKTTRTLTISGRTASALPAGIQPQAGPPNSPGAGNGYNNGGNGNNGNPNAPEGGNGNGRGGPGMRGMRGGGTPPGGGYNPNGAVQTDRPITIKSLTETEYIGQIKE